MCEHGTTIIMRVYISAHLSHTGKPRWGDKPIDLCIARLIAALNRAGLHTANSCCGHGKGTGSVIFADGSELTIEEAERLVW